VLEIVFWGLFSLILLGLLFSIVFWTVRANISPVPTSPKVLKVLFQELPEQLEGTILELGSGWGTLTRMIARKYPQSSIIGYEISPIPYFISKFLCRDPHCRFVLTDFFNESFADASCIICYLYPAAMQRLGEKFLSELAPRVLIVSHTFAIPGWEPEKIVEVDDLYRSKLYFYRTK
jgi:hypothetical protein